MTAAVFIAFGRQVTFRDRIGTIIQRLTEIVTNVNNVAQTISIVALSNAGIITVPGGRMGNVK